MLVDTETEDDFEGVSSVTSRSEAKHGFEHSFGNKADIA